MKRDPIPLKRWEDYQRKALRRRKLRSLASKMPLAGLYGTGLFIILAVFFFTGSWLSAHLEVKDQEPFTEKTPEVKGYERLTGGDLPSLLKDLKPVSFSFSGKQVLTRDGEKLTIETSLDADLQNYILDLLQRSMTYKAAVIVMKPADGRVLAMANYDSEREGGKENLCLRAEFPAASLFKIISAAAAIEQKDFTPDKVLSFRGKKHTLYKSQLKQNQGRYGTKASFKEAFAGSINPVFGKIGIYELGQALIAEYAEKFLFNRMIPFDLPVDKSIIDVPVDAFGLAEIASGFNKRTLLSPLHAAMITAAIANGGTMMRPWFIESIKDDSGRVLYKGTSTGLSKPITEQTARTLRILMSDTINHGTGRKALYPLRRKKSFKHIALGAKTGTINDPSDRFKFDWLTAYALPQNDDAGICVTVLAMHGEKLGIRARDIARYVIERHFYLLRKEI